MSSLRIDGFKDMHGRDWSGRFKNRVANGIPYGFYEVSARSETWATTFSERVDVNAPSVLVTAVFGFSGLEVGGSVRTRVTGSVKGLFAANGDAWCKLSGVYSRDQYEVTVKTDGSFDFGDVNVGKYVAMCGKDAELEVLEPVKITGGISPILLKSLASGGTINPAP